MVLLRDNLNDILNVFAMNFTNEEMDIVKKVARDHFFKKTLIF